MTGGLLALEAYQFRGAPSVVSSSMTVEGDVFLGLALTLLSALLLCAWIMPAKSGFAKFFYWLGCAIVAGQGFANGSLYRTSMNSEGLASVSRSSSF